MGKAAARCSDPANTCNDPTDLPTGTVIAAGTVLINKLPAAKQNDQIVGVDTHIIMIPTPGGPVPTPLPHPFNGMITSGCSTSVNIAGMPAATVDSQADNLPPHIPQGGPFQKPPMNKAKIIMGSTNVFIGGGSGGGGGGSGGGDSATASAAATEAAEGHYLDVKVVDKGGKPIVGGRYKIKDPDGVETTGPLTGQIRKMGVAEGDHEIKLSAITLCAWSEKAARDGDKVKMQLETLGVEDGEDVIFQVWQRDINSADKEIARVDDVKLDGGKAEAEWAYRYVDDYESAPESRQERGYSHPSFYFTVQIGDHRSRSPVLAYKDYIEITGEDNEGNKLADEPYEIRLPHGEVQTGTLDSNGYKKVENVPPGPWDVRFPNRDNVREND